MTGSMCTAGQPSSTKRTVASQTHSMGCIVGDGLVEASESRGDGAQC